MQAYIKQQCYNFYATYLTNNTLSDVNQDYNKIHNIIQILNTKSFA